MVRSPQWKVFGPNGDFRASCKHLEDAACLVEFYGDGASISIGYMTAGQVWKEGEEDQPAGESYDHVAAVAAERYRQRGAERAVREAILLHASEKSPDEVSMSTAWAKAWGIKDGDRILGTTVRLRRDYGR